MQWRAALFGLLSAACAAAVVTGMLIALPGVLAVIDILALIVEAAILPREKRRLVARFDDVFERIHERELLMRDRDMDPRALWSDVHPHAREVAQKCCLQSFGRLTRSDRAKLNALIEEEIPRLRSDLYARFGDADAPAQKAQLKLSEVVSGRDDGTPSLVAHRRAV